MIDRTVFDTWIAVFSDQIGKPLEGKTIAVYYVALSQEMDTATFERAALLVAKKHAWNTWPQIIEFLSAAVTVRRRPDAEVTETWRRVIAPSLRLLPAGERGSAEFEDFAGPNGWRKTLAHCAPEATRAARRPAATIQWASDPTTPRVARALDGPTDGPMPGPSLDDIAAQDVAAD